MMGLNELMDRVHALAIEKGWYDDVESPPSPRTLAAWLCNIHGEISEALEDVRSGRLELRYGDGYWQDDSPPGEPRMKPVGLPSELADALIRILDTCGALGIDIEHAVETKHHYNQTRSHRHGGKKL
jgi:NTP pyrophosphatase (non-canonical NTP hydrolase)